LFAPFGFLAVASLANYRPPLSRVACAVATVVAALITSAALEGLQIFVPPRTVAISDMLAAVIGASSGLAIWLWIGRDLESLVDSARTDAVPRPSFVFWLLVAYALMFVFAHVWPLDLTADLGELGRKYRQGGIAIVPTMRDLRGLSPWEFPAAIPIGMLAARLFSRRNVMPGAVVIVMVTLCALEALQVLIYSQRASTVDLALSIAGALFGLVIARTSGPFEPAPNRAFRAVGPLVPAIWVAFLVLWQWWPFTFEPSPDFLRARIFELPKVPFESYYRSPTPSALIGLFWKLFLGLGTGFVVGWSWPAGNGPRLRHLRLASQLTVAITLFVILETGQLFLQSRFPDPTDVAVETAGSLLALAAGHKRSKTFVS
jgi:glycopeptide antibiotics resistance protein